eukprot:5297327-Pyramimonas_sp.AAC.3
MAEARRPTKVQELAADLWQRASACGDVKEDNPADWCGVVKFVPQELTGRLSPPTSLNNAH